MKADGANVAQKWLRLLKQRKEQELREMLDPKTLAALTPKERHLLFYCVLTNCTMHNMHLGAKYGLKASRAVTDKLIREAGVVEAMRAAGYTSDGFTHCPLPSAGPSNPYHHQTLQLQ